MRPEPRAPKWRAANSRDASALALMSRWISRITDRAGATKVLRSQTFMELQCGCVFIRV